MQVMRCLIVAVGGGGDAITATTLQRLLGLTEPAPIMTYAWDRLMIDPLPGPRSVRDFAGLRTPADNVHQVTSTTTPRAPAGSSLPRIAADTGATLLLLDPTRGAVGMARQIQAAAAHLNLDRIVALDVGGDALTDGHDPELRSPLADQLALAACLRSELPTQLVIAAPGLDGEIPSETVLHRLNRAGATPFGRLSPADLDPARVVYSWHPSEASGLLATAVDGARGTVEVRDAGDQITLSDSTAALTAVDLDALAGQIPATKLVDTHALDDAEAVVRDLTGISELRYETAKAAKRNEQTARMPTLESLTEVDTLSEDARRRGADYISTRRLAELLGCSSLDTFTVLNQLLAEHRSDRHLPAAYRVSPNT